MIIGFLSTNIQDLKLFKEYIQKYPQFDYYAYVATGVSFDKKQIVEALQWIREKKVEIVAVGEGIDTESFKKNFLINDSFQLCVVSELLDCLEKSSNKGGGGTQRSIHITQHSKAQDQAIAEILGGLFIEG